VKSHRGQLGDVAAHLSLGGDAVGVVVGTEVEESGGGVRKQLPDDPQDGAGDRDEGFEPAAAFDDAPVAFVEEGVGLGGRDSGLAECALEVGVALAGLAAAAYRPGLDGARAEFGPRDQVLGGGEAAHVQPDFGQDVLCIQRADTRDFVESLEDAGRVIGRGGPIEPEPIAAAEIGTTAAPVQHPSPADPSLH